jgi:curved DNA-binding protein CbpA
MPTTKRDYYEVLGVARGAPEDEIKRAYRKLALSFRANARNLSIFILDSQRS